MPKRGFNNHRFATNLVAVNISRLQEAVDAKKLDAKKPVNAEALIAAGIIHKALDGIKIIGSDEIKVQLTIEATKASKGAIAAVEKAGGSITLPEAVEKAPSKKRRHLAMKERAEA